MFSKIKKRILNYSNSYNFYKNNYEKLLLDIKNKDRQLNYLKKENKKLNILNNKYSSILEKQNENINQTLTNSYALLSGQDENSILLARINSILLNFTEKKLSSIEENSYKTYKSTTHTNIKIDSRFMEQERFIEDLLNTNKK